MPPDPSQSPFVTARGVECLALSVGRQVQEVAGKSFMKQSVVAWG